MNYWLIALPREDMEHCISIGTFGMKRKGQMTHAKKGDKIACYITKEYKIIALGELVSDYYMDDSDIFRRNDVMYPDRFDFKAAQFQPGEELDFMQIIDKMSFITNLAYWSAYFRNGLIKMAKSDWETISVACKSPNVTARK